MTIIRSTQNKRVKFVKALQNKARLRRGKGLLILEGSRLIGDALNRGGAPHLALYAPERADYELIARLQQRDCEALAASDDALAYISDTQRQPGLLAVFHIPKPPLPKTPRRALILDGISEPGNMGAILRAATAAGVDIAILAPGCVDPYNSKAMRSGMGAHFQLPIVEAPWNEVRGYCARLAIFCADAHADLDYADVDWREDWALIIGGEAHGLSRQARKAARSSISIPLANATESLNAAAAAAVILFEARRQTRLAR